MFFLQVSLQTITALRQQIATHTQNSEMIKKGYAPLFSAHPEASVVLIGQAPGAKTHEAGKPWADQSGQQLRRWLGISDDTFYDETKLALVPMDFYFPGKGKNGDLPPRKGIAELWHPKIFACMPNLQLKILVGQYSQAYYLANRKATLTATVKNYQQYVTQGVFPLPHPSPRNNIWKKKNPWFEQEVVPALQTQIAQWL